MYLQQILCRLRFVKYQESRETGWGKNQHIIRGIKATLHHRRNIFIVTNCTVFVPPPGVIESLDLTKASVYHAHYYLKDVKELFSICIIQAIGYIVRQHQINLFRTAGIQLVIKEAIKKSKSQLSGY